MAKTLRQKLYELKSIDELRYVAMLGSCFGTGSTPDISYITKFGFSDTLSTSGSEEIWSNGGSLTLLDGAETMNIASDSSNDTTSGSGVDMLFISGLDANFDPQQEIVTLNGTTNVPTASPYSFIYRMSILNATGTGQVNAGDITATAATAGTVQAHIPAGDGITHGSHFIVPRGYNALMTDLHLSCFRTSGSGARRAFVDLNFMPIDTPFSDRLCYDTIKLGVASEAGLSVNEFHNPLVIAEKNMVYLTGEAEANNTRVSFEYDIILVKTVVDIDTVF